MLSSNIVHNSWVAKLACGFVVFGMAWAFVGFVSMVSAQIPTPQEICESNGGTWNTEATTCDGLAGSIVCDVFIQLELPLPEECGGEGNPPVCDEGEVLDGDVCVLGDDESDNDNSGEDGEETNPPADTGSSSGGGGGGGGSHSKKAVVTTTGEVLGTTTVACDTPLLTTYLGLGKANNLAEVVRLQLFLNNELGVINSVNGRFDAATKAAVEQFQLKYEDEVLTPWIPFGLAPHTPTGYVYKTTQRMINKLHCATLDIPMPQLP